MSKQLEIINKNKVTILEQIDREKVKSQIYEIRGLRVMLDSDIAAYFGVETAALNRAMKRNIKRFPPKFCFQISREEYHEILRCQFGILELEQGKYSKYLPYVYTEHGLSMLTSVLHTDRAIEASILIMEVFVEPLKLSEYNDFLKEYPDTNIKFITSSGRVHDRYIAVDFGTENERLYHCGASSKDAGHRITTILEIKGIADYKNTLESLLLNKELKLN